MAPAPAVDIVTVDALSCTPHTRTQDQLACIAKLLSTLPLYSRLLPDALEAAARQVQSLCFTAGAELPRPSDGRQCILTLLSGRLSLICGSPEDPDLQELLQQLSGPEAGSESDSDNEDARGLGTSTSPGTGGMAAAGAAAAGHGARVSNACFEIQSCHWGDFLLQSEKRSSSPSSPRSGASSPVSGASSSNRTKHPSGSSSSTSKGLHSSSLQLPAAGSRFKQATRTVTFGRPRQQQPSSLGGQNAEGEKRGLWYRVKKAVQVTSDRIAQQQQERMAEAQAQLQQMLLSQHAAANKGSGSHAAGTSSSSTAAAAAAKAGVAASQDGGPGHRRRLDPKDGWLRGITLSQCQPGSSLTAAPFSLQGLPEGLDATVPVDVAPITCLAAVAEGRQQVHALWISRQAFAHVLTLHQDRANCRAMLQLCRMPCLRHSPLRELQKMAPYMQQVTLAPGTVLLEQDRVVSFVYFLLSGQVQLQVFAGKGRSHSPDPFTDTKSSAAAAGTSSSKVAWATGVLDNAAAGMHDEGTGKEAGELLVVGTRGPGAILGDDCVREKRMAVTVVAVTEITAIRMLPQKFLTALDPLTARLFGRLRNQQGAGQALLVKDGIAARNRCELADHFRNTVLGQVYKATDVPSTLVRQQQAGGSSSSSDSRRPAWITGRERTVTTAGGMPRGLARAVTMKPGGFGPGRGALDTQGSSAFGLGRTTTGIPIARQATFGRVSSSLGMVRTLSSGSMRVRSSRSGLDAESSYESTASGFSCSSRSMSGHLGLSNRHNRDPALPSVMAKVDQIRARSTSPDLLKTAVWKTIDPLSSQSLRASTGSLRATLSRQQQQQQQQGAAAPEDEVWADCLPRGLTREMCEALGTSESVEQLVQIIAEVDDTRRSQGPMLPDLTATSPSRMTQTSTWAPDRTRSPEPHWSRSSSSLTPGSPGLTITSTAMLTSSSDAAGSASGAGAVTTSSLPEQRAYIDLVECCCLAVMTMAVAPGQTSGTGASTGLGSGAIASIIDDVAASWSAVAHDEGMQLVRWSPWQWMVVQDLEDDAVSSAPVFCAALFKLISRWRKVLKGEAGPYMQLGIGAAIGSCFLTQEGGFVTAVTGTVYDASEQLSVVALEGARPSNIMVTDGLALLLGGSHALHFAPGGYMLQGPRSTGTSDVGGGVVCRDSGGGEQPLGPRGMASNGGGGPNMTGPCSTANLINPSTRRSARQRRQIRRKFEALERLLEVGEALMVPPPEEMLTQPPPVTDLEEVRRTQAPVAAHGSSRLASAGRQGRPSGFHMPFGSATTAADAAAGGDMGASGGPNLTTNASMRRRPALSIQVAGSGAGDEDGDGPMTGSKVSFAPPSPTKGPGQGLFPGLQNVLKGTMSAAAMAATPKAGRDGTWGGSGVRSKVWQDVAAARESADTASTSGGAASGSPHSETAPALPATTPGGRKRSTIGGQQPLPSMISEFSDFSSDCKTPQDRRGTAAGVRFASGQPNKDAAAGDEAGIGDENACGRDSKRSGMAGPMGQAAAAARGVRFSAPGASNRPSSRSGAQSVLGNPLDGSSCGGGAEDLDAPHFEVAVAGSRALGSTAGAAYFLQNLPEGLDQVNLSVLGLPHLPVQLLRLDSLSILAASNNRLRQLSLHETEVPSLTSPRSGVPRSRSPSPSRSTTRPKSQGREGTPAAVAGTAGVGTPLPDTLTVLGWATNELEELPEDLGEQLPLLEVVDLTHNKLTVLPDSISGLSNLQCLSLAHNELGQLPSSFSCLVSLQQLHLEGNQLRYMPPGLQALQQLQVLNLSRNALRQLPAAVWGMEQLRELDASHNQLRQLPTNCLNGMASLRILRLAGNQLKDIRSACSGSSSSSSSANGAPGLAGASVEGEEEQEGVQAVAAVAAGAGAPRAPLQRLQLLDVSGNLLEQLPLWLPPSLTELNASGNCLASLPLDMLSRLSRRLVALQLAHNQLPGLPLHLTCLTALRLLSIGGNPGIDGSEEGLNCQADAGRGQQQPGAAYLPGPWPLQWIAAQRRGEPWPGMQAGKP